MNARAYLLLAPLFWTASHAYSAGITNGSFETPVVTSPSQFQTILSGAEPLGFGWTVSTGSVDAVVQGTGFGTSAFDGLQWLDLDGVNPGTISQSFSTAAGITYTMGFAYANNPHATGGATVPAAATVQIFDTGTTVDLIAALGITHSSSTVANLDWVAGNVMFTAAGTATTLYFHSTNPGASRGGIFLDAVSISPVPEPSNAILLLVGLVGIAGLARSRSRKS